MESSNFNPSKLAADWIFYGKGLDRWKARAIELSGRHEVMGALPILDNELRAWFLDEFPQLETPWQQFLGGFLARQDFTDVAKLILSVVTSDLPILRVSWADDAYRKELFELATGA